MAVITTGNFARRVFPGVRKIYGERYDEWPSEYTRIYTKVTSDKRWEEYLGHSDMGLFQVKHENSPIKTVTAEQGFLTRVTNVAYAARFLISKEMQDDDQYGGIVKTLTGNLAFAANQTKELVAAGLFDNGFDSGFPVGDGAALFSASHQNRAGGTWSNVPVTNSDLNLLALEQAVIDIRDFRSDSGHRIHVEPQKLVYPKELDFEAHRLLGGDMEPYTADRNINVLNRQGIFKELVCWRYLFDPDAWFILTDIASKEGQGLIYQERTAREIMPSDDSATLDAIFSAFERYAFAALDPRSAYGCPGV